jgi:3-oxoadipate enol-lactonase
MARPSAVPLHHREAGSGGEVLLLLHGFPFHSGMWRPQLDAPPEGWRVIAPDLRGFGRSPATEGKDFGMDAAAADVAALLQRLGIARAVVCGLSMGGYVAFAMLRNHASLVRGLVLCDTRAAADTDEVRRGRQQSVTEIGAEGTTNFNEAMLGKLLSPFTQERRPEVVEEVRAMMVEARPESVIAALHGLASRPDSTPMLRGIVIPTLVIVGEDDEITPPREAQIVARGIPGARLEIVPDAAHLPSLENPEVFDRLLSGFLADMR